MLVIFDEGGGNIDTVKIEIINKDMICSFILEVMLLDVKLWKMDDKGKLVISVEVDD